MKKESEVEKREDSKLKLICSNDPEAYEALWEVLISDSRKIKVSMEKAAKKEEFVIAGNLALFQGNVEKVIEYF